MRRLAVYGSLRPGGANAHVLEPIGGSWSAGWLRGRLIEKATYGGRYPAVVLDDGGERVAVDALESEALGGHWARLDAFEGPEYVRVATTIMRSAGADVPGMVSVLRGG